MKAIFFSKYRPAILLFFIMGFQLALSLPRINEPILDGRLHWYWGNAFFLLKAKHSNTVPPRELVGTRGDVLRVFGTANYAYDSHGRPTEIKLYSHHPILTPTLFRLYTKILGYGNWVPRSFMLMLSLMTTLVLFLLLRSVLHKDLSCALVVLLYSLLPLYFTYMDQWKDENMGTLLSLLSFLLLGKATLSRTHRLLFLVCFFLLFQSAWIAYYAAPCMIYYLYANRRGLGYHRLYVQAILVLILAIGINFAILYQLGFNLAEMKSTGASRLSGGFAQIGIWTWTIRQWSYLQMNFGEINLALYLVGMTFLLLRGRGSTNMLLFASLTFTFSWVCHVGLFRNLSWIHHFVQWSFGPAYILLIAGILSEVRKEVPGIGTAKPILAALVLTLFAFTAADSYHIDKSIRASTFGHVSDLESIRSLQNRVIVFSDGRSGPADWWFGPAMDLARDPIFQGLAAAGPVERIEDLSQLNAGTDVIAVLNSKNALASVDQFLETRFGITHIRPIRSSYSFTFFEVLG